MKLEEMSTAELIALVKRQEQQLTGSVGVTAAELSCVINWLEGGRDPKDAAKELRLYCERAWTGTQPVQQPAPVAIAKQPISSAPRDGSNILLFFGQDGVSQAKYVAGLQHPWQFIDTNDGITWLINHAVDGPGGPSHWQPLPSFDAPVAAPVAGPNQKLYRFDVLDRRGTVLAEGIGVHAVGMQEAETKARKMMKPGENNLRFKSNSPCHPARKCAICAPVPAASVQDDWQPIETAPNDGRTILLGAFNSMGNWCTMRGQWFTKATIDDEWEETDGFDAGWYETAVEPDVPNCWAISPTHWMPLPGAPDAVPPDIGRDAALVEQLREYAGNAGYSHNDYADTMRQAAEALAAHPAPSIDAAQFVVQRPDGYFHIAAGRAVERAEDAKKFSEADAAALANIFTSEHRENAMTSASKAVREFKLTQCAKVIQVAHPANVAQPVSDAGKVECVPCNGHGATHYPDGEWEGKCAACGGEGWVRDVHDMEQGLIRCEKCPIQNSANVAQVGELSDAQMPTKQEIIEFGASLVDHASTTDRMNEREVIAWVAARFDEWFAAIKIEGGFFRTDSPQGAAVSEHNVSSPLDYHSPLPIIYEGSAPAPEVAAAKKGPTT